MLKANFDASREALMALLAKSPRLERFEEEAGPGFNLAEFVFPEDVEGGTFRGNRRIARDRQPEEISIYFDQDEPNDKLSFRPSFETDGELHFDLGRTLDEDRAYRVAEVASGTMPSHGFFSYQVQNSIATPKPRGLGKPDARTKTATESVWSWLTGGVENTADEMNKTIPGVNQGRVQFEINELQVFRNNLESPAARAIVDNAIAQLSANALPMGDLATARTLRSKAQEQALAQSRAERERRNAWPNEMIMPSMEQGVSTAPSILPDILDGGWAAEGGEFPNIHSPLFDIFASKPRGRGERNWAHSASAAGENKYKHLKPDEDDPRMVKRKNSQSGKEEKVVKPSDFDEWWADKEAKRKKFRR